MANKAQIKLLRQGAGFWNSIWSSNITDGDYYLVGDLRVYLSEEDFIKKDLQDVNLSGAELNSINLGNADLRGADFSAARLCSASLGKANLRGANLNSADLRYANLWKANLSGANLGKAKLDDANLSGATLFETDLSGADLNSTDLSESNLSNTNLCGADLYKANLSRANLSGANLSGANLSRANLSGANLSGANLSGANLNSANLRNSNLVDAKLFGTDLSGCNIFGISVWNAETDGSTKQNNLVITKLDESIITVDNIEVAQFIYLMLNNQKIRDVINTITSKVVLILGRFTSERKIVLDAIRKELRNHNFTPVLFDFDKPDDRNFIETVSTLAHMARFVIADFTDPKIVLQEAQHIIPNIAIPFVPIFLNGSGFEPVTLYDLRKGRTTVLDTYCYNDAKHLLDNLYEMLIKPAEILAGKLNMENPLD
ncbi:pentapeptide repeat-containing protein [Desulfosporosinus sp. HMP52]|uniref:pentapeptide repeat-containing protein n=1 Tax=Desulfosporosinus sp. HMP52 TaxID=1487923 RepID=UPI00068C3645|nr:pentapeptide repeat-containing protein [Desulfosporosinus sp. HMP52]